MDKRAESVRGRPKTWDYEAEYRLAIKKLWPDLLIKVEDRIFSTHRHLFIHYCEYFKDFFAKVYDKYPDQRKFITSIALSDFSSSNFATVLNWMYTGAIDLNNDNVAEIFQISRHFEITGLISKTSKFAQNYVKTYDDFYKMCCNLAPMAPSLFYSLLELGYLSPFPCDSYLDDVVEFISDPPTLQNRDLKLDYSEEWKEFRIHFDFNHDTEDMLVMNQPPLNCAPIPLKTLNVLLGKHPKTTILKASRTEKNAKYVTALEGKIERKKPSTESKISTGTAESSQSTCMQTKSTTVTSTSSEDKSFQPPPPPPPPPPSQSPLQTTALPAHKGTGTEKTTSSATPPPPPPQEYSGATASTKNKAVPKMEKDKRTTSTSPTSPKKAPTPVPPPNALAETGTATTSTSKVATTNEPQLEVETVKAAEPLGSTPTNPETVTASSTDSAQESKTQQQKPSNETKQQTSSEKQSGKPGAPPPPPPLPPN